MIQRVRNFPTQGGYNRSIDDETNRQIQTGLFVTPMSSHLISDMESKTYGKTVWPLVGVMEVLPAPPGQPSSVAETI